MAPNDTNAAKQQAERGALLRRLHIERLHDGRSTRHQWNELEEDFSEEVEDNWEQH
jgi:hypothetical protein